MSLLAQSGVVEVIHGVEVRDPYRWLEDRELPETEEWVKSQNRLCEEYFSRNRFYKPLKKIVADTLSVEVIDQAARVRDSIFLRKQLKGQEQAAIWVRHDGESKDRLLVDPAALGHNISVSILRVSPDASFLAYSVRSCGSDAMEVRITDVATGVAWPDRLPLSYIRGFAFDALRRGFYYCTELTGDTLDLSIKYHRFGESPFNDVCLFSVPWAEHRRLTMLSGSGTLVALVTELAGVETVQDLYTASESSNTDWTLAFRELRGRKWPMLAHGRLFLFDMDSTPNGSLAELGRADEARRVVVPEGTNTIQRVWAVRTGFLVVYLVDRQPRVEQWSIEGKFIRSLVLPRGGSIEFLAPCIMEPSSLFLLHESYTEAPSLWECAFAGEDEQKLVRWTVAHEQSPATVRESWYFSSDGARIPMILLEPQKKRPGPQPVVLFGYGGFGATEMPRYSRLAKILVELGVTSARSGIRGGAEFGEQWHQAATGKKRQTAIDDFLAAAESLLAAGITDEEHLAIMGSSNGGLLVAAAAIQRPDIFKAVVCTGPLTDMVRYECFDRASRWRREYGTAENAQDFQALLAYSPYHNLKQSIDYPAMFFVTGDADDRCNPAHARKMAAALQERGAQQHPILLDHSAQWGHMPTLSLTERTEALTRKIAFLCEQLDLAMCEGAVNELLDF
jgi:prolyl oligopeptidase